MTTSSRSFSSYFTTHALVTCLCRERLAISKNLHDRQYFDRLVPSSQKHVRPKIVELMPPRTRWMRPRAAEREGGWSPLAALIATVMRLRDEAAPQDSDWIAAQDQVFSAVRSKALGQEAPQLGAPVIVPTPKPGKKDGCRVLALYSLVDKIVIGISAAYLRTQFEALFRPCSYAFRARRLGGGAEPLPTHHDAVVTLSDFWAANEEGGEVDAWASECDIQGFFDCVCHATLVKTFDRHSKTLSKRGFEIEDRARAIFRAYLDSYDYPNYARPRALSIIKKEGRAWNVTDRDPVVLPLHPPGGAPTYGIPQGGALSCFAANLMLHDADEAVLRQLEPSDYYARYCDDMLVIAMSDERVRAATTAYTEELRAKRLPVHPFESNPYGKHFWDGKSKSPYRWRRPDGAADVPWISFVGYQLRYDGQLRIRPSSLNKELKKQADLTGEFLGRVGPALTKGTARRSWKRLLRTLVGRLEAMSVGRRNQYDYAVREPESCWCAGFLALVNPSLPDDQWILRSQLRALDRGRGRQIARARRKLLSIKPPGSGKGASVAGAVKSGRPHRFSGRPHSYAGQMEGLEKRHHSGVKK